MIYVCVEGTRKAKVYYVPLMGSTLMVNSESQSLVNMLLDVVSDACLCTMYMSWTVQRGRLYFSFGKYQNISIQVDP